LVDKLYQQVVVTSDKNAYLVRSRGP